MPDLNPILGCCRANLRDNTTQAGRWMTGWVGELFLRDQFTGANGNGLTAGRSDYEGPAGSDSSWTYLTGSSANFSIQNNRATQTNATVDAAIRKNAGTKDGCWSTTLVNGTQPVTLQPNWGFGFRLAADSTYDTTNGWSNGWTIYISGSTCRVFRNRVNLTGNVTLSPAPEALGYMNVEAIAYGTAVIVWVNGQRIYSSATQGAEGAGNTYVGIGTAGTAGAVASTGWEEVYVTSHPSSGAVGTNPLGDAAAGNANHPLWDWAKWYPVAAGDQLPWHMRWGNIGATNAVTLPAPSSIGWVLYDDWPEAQLGPTGTAGSIPEIGYLKSTTFYANSTGQSGGSARSGGYRIRVAIASGTTWQIDTEPTAGAITPTGYTHNFARGLFIASTTILSITDPSTVQAWPDLMTFGVTLQHQPIRASAVPKFGTFRAGGTDVLALSDGSVWAAGASSRQDRMDARYTQALAPESFGVRLRWREAQESPSTIPLGDYGFDIPLNKATTWPAAYRYTLGKGTGAAGFHGFDSSNDGTTSTADAFEGTSYIAATLAPDKPVTTVYNRGHTATGDLTIRNVRDEGVAPVGTITITSRDVGTAATEQTATHTHLGSGVYDFSSLFATAGNVAPATTAGAQKALRWRDSTTNAPVPNDVNYAFLSSLYNLAKHLQLNDNVLNPALGVSSRLTSDLGFFTVKITDQQAQGVNGAVGRRSLVDDKSLTAGIVDAADITTTTVNGHAGYTPLRAWDSPLPSGGWDLWASTQFTKDGNTTADVRPAANTFDYQLLAINPSYGVLVGAGPNGSQFEGNHWSPGEDLLLGVAMFDASKSNLITPDTGGAGAPHVHLGRFRADTGSVEYLVCTYDVDGVTILSTTWTTLPAEGVPTANIPTFSAALVGGDARVFINVISGLLTAAWDATDFFIIGHVQEDGTPYWAEAGVEVVGSAFGHAKHYEVVTSGGPVVKGDHWSPGMTFQAGAAIIDFTDNSTVAADVAEVALIRLQDGGASAGQGEYLAADGVTWVPLADHTTDVHWHVATQTRPNSGVYIKMFASTSGWGEYDIFVLGRVSIGGRIYGNYGKEIGVGVFNKHSRYAFDGPGFMGFPTR